MGAVNVRGSGLSREHEVQWTEEREERKRRSKEGSRNDRVDAVDDSDHNDSDDDDDDKRKLNDEHVGHARWPSESTHHVSAQGAHVGRTFVSCSVRPRSLIDRPRPFKTLGDLRLYRPLASILSASSVFCVRQRLVSRCR